MAVYAISDLHGRKDKYDQMIHYLNPEDTLYILGDVIDRGEDGVAILQDIMQRDNVILLMGNHEKMMLDYLRSENETDGDYFLYLMHKLNWEQNGNYHTLTKYRALSQAEQCQIYDFLQSLSVCVADLKVNGRCFYLAHAFYEESCRHGIYYAQDVSDAGLRKLLWHRYQPGEKLLEDVICVCGHTPCAYYHSNGEVFRYMTTDSQGYIDVDSGFGMRNCENKLTVLRIDDLEVLYF